MFYANHIRSLALVRMIYNASMHFSDFKIQKTAYM